LTYSIWAGNYALVVPKQHRHVLTAAGFTKKDIREFVFDGARVTRREWRSVGKAAVAGRKDEDAVYTALRAPDDLLVVAAGGPAVIGRRKHEASRPAPAELLGELSDAAAIVSAVGG